jgi:DNA-binding PadR family transcriptional regulator
MLLEALIEQPSEWRHGYDLSRQTGLKSGTLYPLLMRLAEYSLLETRWDQPTVPGRPPRHMYRLTALGQRVAHEKVPAKARRARLKLAHGER